MIFTNFHNLKEHVGDNLKVHKCSLPPKAINLTSLAPSLLFIYFFIYCSAYITLNFLELNKKRNHPCPYIT